MTVARFWTYTTAEVIIRGKGGGKGSGGKTSGGKGGGKGKDGGGGGGGSGGWTGRGGKGGPTGGGGNGDLAPDVVAATLGGATVEFDLSDTTFNRYMIVWNNLLCSVASQYMYLDLRRKSDSQWEAGASAYRHFQIRTNTAVGPQDQSAHTIQQVPAGPAVMEGEIFLSNPSIAVPTVAQGRAWSAGASEVMSLIMNDVIVHDMVRLRLAAGVFTSADAFHIVRME